MGLELLVRAVLLLLTKADEGLQMDSRYRDMADKLRAQYLPESEEPS